MWSVMISSTRYVRSLFGQNYAEPILIKCFILFPNPRLSLSQTLTPKSTGGGWEIKKYWSLINSQCTFYICGAHKALHVYACIAQRKQIYSAVHSFDAHNNLINPNNNLILIKAHLNNSDSALNEIWDCNNEPLVCSDPCFQLNRPFGDGWEKPLLALLWDSFLSNHSRSRNHRAAWRVSACIWRCKMHWFKLCAFL